MWLLKACFLLILPEPVTLKRFLALDLVFILGIFPKNLITTYYLVSPSRPSPRGGVVPPLGVRGLFFLLRRDEHNHPLSFENRHGFDLSVFFQVLGQTQKQDLSLLFVNDRTAFKEYERFEF